MATEPNESYSNAGEYMLSTFDFSYPDNANAFNKKLIAIQERHADGLK